METGDARQSKLAILMSETARMLRADFERSRLIRHRGEKGTVRENMLIASLLADHLPGKVKINPSCEIIDSHGSLSPQVDIAIYDPASPTIYRHGDFRIFPAEGVYGTIEVKSELTEPQLKKSIEDARQVKRLAKTEYDWKLNAMSREYNGRTWEHCHTVSYLFAYGSSDLTSLAKFMANYYSEHSVPGEERLDGVWVLGKGTICWVSTTTQTIVPFPDDSDYLAAMEAHPERDVLLNMIVLLNSHFSTVWMPPFRMNSYATGTIGRELGVFPVKMSN